MNNPRRTSLELGHVGCVHFHEPFEAPGYVKVHARWREEELSMSFGRNPHVAKAETAEQKARSARDAAARELAWRDAAHQWDRAAGREKDDKRRQLYADNAQAAREQADSPVVSQGDDSQNSSRDPIAGLQANKPTLLN